MDKLLDEITIRIRPMDGSIIVEERKNNIVAVKAIAPDSLMECLEKGIKESKEIKSGFLPENCISYKVSDRNKVVALWIPPGYVDFTYHKTLYERFPMPAMAFSFCLNASGKTTSHRMAVIGYSAPKPDTQVYAYPFSNVYATSEICIGAANSLPVHKNIRSLGTLPYHILRLPNNDHMFSQNNNKMRLMYRDLLEHLKDKEPEYYYEHILIPAGAVLQDFIDEKWGKEH